MHGKEKMLYQQVAERLKEQIVSGTLHIGEKIPSEQWLQQTYNVSRVTVRKALDLLVEQGYLEHRPHQGKFVMRWSFENHQAQLYSIHAYLNQSGRRSTSKIMKIELIEADEKIAQKMNLPVGEQLMYIRRVRYVDDKVYAFVEHWLRMKYMKDRFNPFALADRSLYDILKNDVGLEFAYQRQYLDASVASGEVRDALEITEQAHPLLVVENTLLVEDQAQVVRSKSLYNTELVPDAFLLNV